jgi:hypothetical protein
MWKTTQKFATSSLNGITLNSSSFYFITFYSIFSSVISSIYPLGPFILIFFSSKSGRILMKNLRFWGNNTFFYNQTFMWIFSLSTSMLYLFSDKLDMAEVHPIEVYTLWISIFVRCFTVACKYATLHPSLIQMYKKTLIPDNLFSSELYFGGWHQQSP